MTNKRVLPDFANEEEEAAWWFEHADELADDFVAAAADGTLGRRRTAERLGLVSNLVTIKPHDADVAREMAARQGVPYETFVADVFHKALETLAKAS
jgi:hypothetical protein